MKIYESSRTLLALSAVTGLILTGCSSPSSGPTPEANTPRVSPSSGPNVKPSDSFSASPTDSSSPGPTGSFSARPTEVDADGFTEAERDYIEVINAPYEDGFYGDVEPDDPATTLKHGYKDCETLAKLKTNYKQAMHVADGGDGWSQAITFLCPEYKPALTIHKHMILGDGTYKVGNKNSAKTVKPGAYRTRGKGLKDCYWSRVTKGGRIIANDFIQYAPGYVTVTIRSSDGGFKTDRCGDWVLKSDLAP